VPEPRGPVGHHQAQPGRGGLHHDGGLVPVLGSFAQYVAGIIATFTATDTVAGQVLDPEAALNGYAAVFGSIGCSRSHWA
jgi:hypothetical protein